MGGGVDAGGNRDIGAEIDGGHRNRRCWQRVEGVRSTHLVRGDMCTSPDAPPHVLDWRGFRSARHQAVFQSLKGHILRLPALVCQLTQYISRTWRQVL